MSVVSERKELTTSVAAAWASGTLGTFTLLAVLQTLILKYGVDTLGLSAALAGLLITATRIFDASIDPLMGVISDRTRSPWGRRRPYLLFGGIMCTVSVILIFADPFSIALVRPATYFTFSLIWFSVAYTIFSVPHLAMSYEMTSVPKERTFLMSFRIYAFAIGNICGASLGPWLLTFFGGGQSGYTGMAWVLSAVIFTACLISFVGTADSRVIKVSKESEKVSLKETVRRAADAIHNRPFVSLIIAWSFYYTGTGIGAATYAFMMTTIMGRSLATLGYMFLAMMACVFISQPFWVSVANRFGKRNCFLIAAPFNAVCVSTFLLTGPDEPVWIIMMRAAFIGIFGGGMGLSMTAMLPDTLQYEYERTGKHQEGTLAGVYTTVERTMSAIGVAISGLILSIGGYISGIGGAGQPSSAVTAIYFAVAIVPACSILASMAFIWRYDLRY
jgi:GPH family glycoside/pentoside/hexuronide:cation symporter